MRKHLLQKKELIYMIYGSHLHGNRDKSGTNPCNFHLELCLEAAVPFILHGHKNMVTRNTISEHNQKKCVETLAN